MANKKHIEEKIKTEQEKKRLSKRKIFRLFPLAALLLTVVLLLFMMVNWAAIYNTTMAGNEIEVSGYNCVAAGLSGDYTSMETGRFGNMAVFNYHAASYVYTLSVVSVIVLFVLIVHAFINLFALITNKQGAFNVIGIVFAVAESALFIACYAVALSIGDSGILTTYCNNNPACSVQSHAVLPALFAIISIAVPVLALIFDLRAQKQLRLEEEAAVQALQSKNTQTGKNKRR